MSTIDTTDAVQATANPNDLIPAERNVRDDLGSPKELEELANSIEANGVLQPLLTYRGQDGNLHILAGHRRQAAALQVGLTEVPVMIVPEPEEANKRVIMLVENIQRADLTPVEEARTFADLKAAGWKQTDIAARSGKSNAHVSNRLRLLALPDDILEMVRQKRITIQDAQSVREEFEDNAAAAEAWAFSREENGGDMFAEFSADEQIAEWWLKDALAAAIAAKALDEAISNIPEGFVFIGADDEDFKKYKPVASLGLTEAAVKQVDPSLLAYAAIDGELTPVVEASKFKSTVTKALKDDEKADDIPDEIKQALDEDAEERAAAKLEREQKAFNLEVSRRAAFKAATGGLKKKADQDELIETFWLNNLSAGAATELVRAMGVEPITHEEAKTEVDAEGEVVAVLDDEGNPQTRTVTDYVATVKREVEGLGVRTVMLTSLLLGDEETLTEAAQSALKDASRKASEEVKAEQAKAAEEKAAEDARKEAARATAKAQREAEKIAKAEAKKAAAEQAAAEAAEAAQAAE